MTAELTHLQTAPEAWGDARSRTVTWHDPMITATGCRLPDSGDDDSPPSPGGMTSTRAHLAPPPIGDWVHPYTAAALFGPCGRT